MVLIDAIPKSYVLSLPWLIGSFRQLCKQGADKNKSNGQDIEKEFKETGRRGESKSGITGQALDCVRIESDFGRAVRQIGSEVEVQSPMGVTGMNHALLSEDTYGVERCSLVSG